MQGFAKIKDTVSRFWLLALIIGQPLLDILAYWTQSPNGTPAGYIRLLIMFVLPLHLLISLKDKKRFIISMLVMALYSAAHVFTSYRAGYVSISFDVSYLIKTLQVPVMAICLCCYIRDERYRKQAYMGIIIAWAIVAASIALACLTGTENVTYGEGLGVSGWVIDDNRCANSAILVSLAVFAVYYACRSDNKWLNFLIPAAVTAIMLTNGTKACYFSLFAIFPGYAFFLITRKYLAGEKLKRFVVMVLAFLTVFSVLIYPYTPRCKVSESQARSAQQNVNEIERILSALGYDLSTMTNEEKLADPVVRGVFEDYYYKMIWHVLPTMFERFSSDEIMLKYNMTTDPATLIDVRHMKRVYASLIWDTCDPVTKLFGYEVSRIWILGDCDLENDWHAVFYYYGYVGFTLYVGFILYFLYLVSRRLLRDFKSAYTLENFVLILALLLQIGLGQFSGSMLRRPNVSIYMAIVLALIYYKTAVAGDVPCLEEVSE